MSRGVVKKKKNSRSARAGLQFPVSRIMRYMRRVLHKRRISAVAPVYLAAVLEYLVAEVVELAGNAARQNKKSRVIPRHILLAIANDDELHRLLRGVTISMGGVLPNIQPELLIKTKGHRKWVEARALASGAGPESSPQASSKAGRPKRPASTPKSTPAKPSKGKTMKKTPAAAKTASPKKRGRPSKKSQTTTITDTSDLDVVHEKTLFLGQKLMVVNGEVAEMSSDAVVHYTNASMYLGGDVGSALLKAGGADFQKEVTDLLASQGSLSMSSVAICPGHGLEAANVIHVHCPQHGQARSGDKLGVAIKNVLGLADDKNLKSVALPTVAHDFPENKSAHIVMDAVKNYFVSVMASSIKEVLFVMSDEEALKHYEAELKSLDSQ